MKNLKELINLAFANRLGKKSSTPYRSAQDEFEPGYNPMTGKTDLNVNALAKKVRETKFTKKYDDNPALKGGQKDLPDALQKGIINKPQNEHHLKNNPDAKYVATAAPNGWFDVWEGEAFAEFSGDGVLVGKFKTMKDAKDYANTKNAEQGKLEEEIDVNDPFLVRMRADKIKREKEANAPKPEKSTNPNYKAIKNASKIKFLEKEKAQVMSDMENDPDIEPTGGPVADMYGDQLNKIDNAIEKLKK